MPPKDRSKERMPGVLSNTLDTASNLYGDMQNVQSGKFGNISYRTNLLDQLGEYLISEIQGRGGSRRRSVERSLFGVEFDLGGDKSIGFETKPIYGEGVAPTRDYRVSFKKTF
tara:strand:- start:91 stop:429 length:339 start_codon:yes stop_codon:yes gene_type:complete